MSELFGMPTSSLLLGLVIVLAAGSLVIGVLSLRNRVIFRIAVRNIPRRKSQTGLIVLGLMLAALLFSSSLTIGDTLSFSIRTQAVQSLGQVDIIVRSETTDVDGRLPYFSESVLWEMTDAVGQLSAVEGIAPIAVEWSPVISLTEGQSEPRVDVLGLSDLHSTAIEPLEAAGGQELEIRDLSADDIFISEALAEELNAQIGDNLRVFIGSRQVNVDVAGVYEKGGVPAPPLSIVMKLSSLQELTGNEGKINSLVINNTGNAVTGASRTQEVTDAIEDVVKAAGLKSFNSKQEALDDADQVGSEVTAIFLLFGQFSVSAGVLLIFLIFVMLAAERKHELGVIRAIAAERGHVIRMFTFEGTLYALIAAATGSLLGMVVGWGLVRIMAVAFGRVDLDLVYSFNWRSLVIGFALGMVVTFVVVTVSSWRVSRLNIVRSIRDLPEPRKNRRGWRSWLMAISPLVFGAMMTLSGIQASQLSPFMIGTSLLIIGTALIARQFGASDRLAFTAAGLLLVLWWLLPSGATDWILGDEVQAGIEMFFISGIMLVLGGVWALMYNYQLLLRGAVTVVGGSRNLAPVIKIAVSYPMQNRFRTGITLALFSLIVFTLVVMAFITAAISGLFDNTAKLSGGFDLRATVSPANPVVDMRVAIETDPSLDINSFKVIASLTGSGVEVSQAGASIDEAEDLYIQGADHEFSRNVSYEFMLKQARFASDSEVWEALAAEPGSVIVPAWMAPSRVNYSTGAAAPFQLEGFYADDEFLPDDVEIVVRDPRSGNQQTLKVIGVTETLAIYVPPLLTSRETVLGLIGLPIAPQAYMFQLAEGVDAQALSELMETALMQHGLQATDTDQEIKDSGSASIMLNQIVQGFMGLGLVVGIAALGVISARSVVERRHQIGMLRAIGFQKGMVQLSFLIETSFISLTGILLGLGLGVGLIPQIVDGMEEQFAGIQVKIPWLNLLIIVAIAYVASLLTTFFPARQASRVYPAEALRYE